MYTHVMMQIQFALFNHFTAPACKMSGLKDAQTCFQTMYFLVLYHLFSMLCALMKVLSHASVKKKTKKLKGFKFHAFYGSFSNDIMAVKGLKNKFLF